MSAGWCLYCQRRAAESVTGLCTPCEEYLRQRVEFELSYELEPDEIAARHIAALPPETP